MSDTLPTQDTATTAASALTPTTLVRTEEVAKMTARELVASNYIKEQVAKALPGMFTPERFMRVTLTAFNKNPGLWDCSKSSIASVILQCAQFGVEPDGRHAHVIPYKGEATLQLDYKGLVALVRRSGDVVSLHVDVVCMADEFDYNLGEVQRHSIDFKKPRGDVYAVYAMARLKDGSSQVQVMTKDEVEGIRKRSRSGASGPWVTDWNEMAKKTVFRRLTKWLPLSFEAAQAVQHDTEREFGNGAIDVTHVQEQAPAPKSLAAKVLAAPKRAKRKHEEAIDEPRADEPAIDDGI